MINPLFLAELPSLTHCTRKIQSRCTHFGKITRIVSLDYVMSARFLSISDVVVSFVSRRPASMVGVFRCNDGSILAYTTLSHCSICRWSLAVAIGYHPHHASRTPYRFVSYIRCAIVYIASCIVYFACLPRSPLLGVLSGAVAGVVSFATVFRMALSSAQLPATRRGSVAAAVIQPLIFTCFTCAYGMRGLRLVILYDADIRERWGMFVKDRVVAKSLMISFVAIEVLVWSAGLAVGVDRWVPCRRLAVRRPQYSVDLSISPVLST